MTTSTTESLKGKWPPWLRMVAVLAVLFDLGAGAWWWWWTLSAWLALVAGGLSLVLLVAVGHHSSKAGTLPGTAFWSVVLGAAAAFALASLMAAWRTRVIGSGTDAPPPTITDPTNASQRAQLLAYAAGLDYDSVTHRASDERFLTIPDTVTVDTVIGPRGTVTFRPLSPPRIRKLVGPRAKIVPERWAFRNSRGDLGPGSGRIVARIFVDPSYRAPNGTPGYAPLKLPPGLSYLWIDNLQTATDPGTARALVIPADPELAVQVDTVAYHSVRRFWETYSRAAWRFSFRNDPDCYNVTCPWGCCDNCHQE